VERFPKPRSMSDCTYRFFPQILSGFEIAPILAADSLTTRIEIRIGHSPPIYTVSSTGRFPLWKWYQPDILVQLDKNISFASDMRVIL
jgi:hypothetical protein